MSKEKETNDTIGKINSNSEQRDLSFEIPIIDAHMHIQSNDIAPLPIMNGMLRYKTSFTWLPAGFINFAYLSSRNIPNFEYDYDPKTDSIYETKNGKTNEIFNLNPFRGSIFHKPEFSNRKLLTNATALITEYGVVTRHCSYSIAGLYQNENISTNLAYPSRWTKAKTANQDDIKKAKNSRKKITDARNDQKWFNNHIQWYENATKYELKTEKSKNIHPFVSNQKMACVMGMELMYSHFWGAYGIPIYLEDANGNIYTIDNFPENLNYPYDMDVSPINEDGDLDLKKYKEKRCSNTQRYSIFLQKLDDKSETYQFEDHFQHIEYQKNAALRYPFRFLPFYHVDPRRFFAPINEIKEKFDFYIPTSKKGIYHKLYDGNKNEEDTEKIKESVTNIICKKNVGDIANGKSFKYSTSIENVKKELLAKDNPGVFWGVKLYVALGYPPYIGCEGSIDGQLVFPGLNKKAYNEFTSFLNWCGENDVPVTCHGSPQGMTIADSEIYLKEYLKQNDNSEFKNQETSEFEPHCKAFMLGLGLIDDFSSPKSWEVVLDKKEIPSKKLRLCLAHFGGKPYFVDEYSMDKDKYAWQKQLVNLIKKPDKKIYTDLSNFMFGKCNFKNILTEYEYNKIIKQNPSVKRFFNMEIEAGNAFYRTILELNNLNIYAESQYEDRQNALQIRFAMLESGVVGKDINTAANHLKELIENAESPRNLKYRIMFGSDYPMFEGTDGVKGVIDYQSSTFIFYQLLTHKLGNKWDAWHQFTVINPLIFLGLINWDDSTNEPEYFDINVKKLNDFKEALKKYNEELPDDTDIDKCRKNLWNLKTKVDINEELETDSKSFDKYKSIPNAKNIVDKNGNMILTGEKKNESND